MIKHSSSTKRTPRRELTALPRLSVNGSYQELRHVETLLSGVPFSLWNLVTSSG